jgi:hypothetical protein
MHIYIYRKKQRKKERKKESTFASDGLSLSSHGWRVKSTEETNERKN